jgi:GNAT superfamily N-acetyltransferase
MPVERPHAVSRIRPCVVDELDDVLDIINAAAEAYRGVIPEDLWHDPYMDASELEGEVEAGVTFWGHDEDGELIGAMGIQSVKDVDLIRHAYVRPERQRLGVGSALLRHLREQSSRPMLVGTWAAATWAIDFYRRHGFELVSPPSERPRFSGPTGRFRSARSRPRSCWPIRRSRTDRLDQRTVILPRRLPSRSMSTRPEMPGTLPELVYCHTQ